MGISWAWTHTALGLGWIDYFGAGGGFELCSPFFSPVLQPPFNLTQFPRNRPSCYAIGLGLSIHALDPRLFLEQRVSNFHFGFDFFVA